MVFINRPPLSSYDKSFWSHLIFFPYFYDMMKKVTDQWIWFWGQHQNSPKLGLRMPMQLLKWIQTSCYSIVVGSEHCRRYSTKLCKPGFRDLLACKLLILTDFVSKMIYLKVPPTFTIQIPTPHNFWNSYTCPPF